MTGERLPASAYPRSSSPGRRYPRACLPVNPGRQEMMLSTERERIRSTKTDRASEFNRSEQRPGISSSVSCLSWLGPKLWETAGASGSRLTGGKVEYSFWRRLCLLLFPCASAEEICHAPQRFRPLNLASANLPGSACL